MSIACLALVGVCLPGTTLEVRGAEQAPAPAPEAAAAQPQPTGDQPKFRCDEPIYNFPDTWAGQKVEHTFIVHNDGKAPLQILRVQPTCGCTLAGEYDKVIEPGKQGRIPLALSTLNQNGLQNKTINVETNDPANARVILTFKGTVKPRFLVEPSGGANWGRATPSSPQSITVKVTSNMPTPLKLEPVPDQPESIFVPTIKELETGKVFEIAIEARKPYRDGQNSVGLRFKTNFTDQPELTIPCNLFSPPLVEVLPAQIIAATSPTREARQQVTVRFNGDGSMKLQSATANNEAIKTEVREQDSGRIFTIALTFPAGFETPPTSPAELEIKTDIAGRESIKVPVRVRVVQPAMTMEMLIGKPAPAVTLKTPDGKDVRVGGAGKVQVVDFWTTWCPHCKRQLPMIQAIANDYTSKGVEFVAVSVGPRQNSPEEVASAAKALQLKMPVAVDAVTPAEAASTKYHATSYPIMAIIGKDGVLEAVHRGHGGTPEGQKNLDQQVRAQLDLLLQGKNRTAFPAAPVVATATQPAAPQPVVQRQGPALAVDMPRHDLGLQKPASRMTVNLNVRNPGTEPVTLSVVKPSEGLKVADDYPKTLAPGAGGEIRCEFQTPDNPGEFTHRFAIESSDPAQKTSEVVLTGKVRPYLEVSPPTGVAFTRNPRTHSIPSIAMLTWNGQDKVNYTKAESSSPKFEAKVEPISDGPYAKLIVTPKPPFELGENKATIRVETDSKEHPAIEVPVSLYMPPRLEVVPAAVIVTPAPRLQRSVVSIRNNGDTSLSILSVKASNPKIHTQFYPDPDGLSYKLMLTIPAQTEVPTLDGEKITIRTDDPDHKEIVIPIKLGTPEDQAKAAAQAQAQ